MEYLIDTDWAIDYMHGHQPVVQRFDELSPLGIGLSIVSLAELYDGMFGAEERLAAEQGSQIWKVEEHRVRAGSKNTMRDRSGGYYGRPAVADLPMARCRLAPDWTALQGNRSR